MQAGPRPVDHSQTTATEFLDDAVVVRDGLADHAQACYGGSVGKSMKARLTVYQKGCWRKIPPLCSLLIGFQAAGYQRLAPL